MEFKKYESIYYYFNEKLNNKLTPTGLFGKSRLACFDLDYTLIKPKSGKKFPIDHTDWEFLFPNKIKQYLTRLIKDNYNIIIFTNQKGISKNKTTIEELTQKLNNIQNELNIDFNILISTIDDKYRKPMTGMWQFLLDQTNINVDYQNSFYVGDAAGRIYDKKKDHSNDDRNFAFNIKFDEWMFITPEMFFDELDGDHTIVTNNLNSYNENVEFNINSEDKNMILLVGPPSSGKSYLCDSLFKTYKRVNQDTLKTQKKCLDKTVKYLKNNRNVIIDNTNPTKNGRKEYLDLATKYGYKKYIINMNIPRNVVKYLNIYRTQTSNNKVLPDVVYNVFYKKYEQPSDNEGIIYNYKNYFIDPKYKF